MAQNNSLNKSSEDFTVDNLFLDGNTLSSTSGTITIDPTTNLLISTGVTNQSVSTAGSTVQYILKNSDNTNSASDAAFYLQSGGTSGGDAYYSWTVGGQGYSMGGDNSDNDYLKMTLSNAFTAGSTVWQMTTAGERTLPLQPAVLAEVTSTITNVTGNNTTYTIVFGSERFDQGGDFDGTSTFTAPVTGRYSLLCQCETDQVTGGTSFQLNLITSNRNYLNAQAITPGASYNQIVSALGDMDAADTATCTVKINGIGADTADVLGGQYTRFCINLAC